MSEFKKEIIENLEEVEYPNIPFENVNYGFTKGFALSVFQIIFTPSIFFKKMHLNKGYAKPLLFLLISMIISTIFNFSYIKFNLIDSPKEQMEKKIIELQDITEPNIILLRNNLQEIANSTPEFSFNFFEIFKTVCLLSIIIIIIGGIWHLILLTFNFPQNGLQGTIRIFCYSSAIFMFNMIPVNLEFKFAVIYFVMIIILFNALKEVHELSKIQSLGAIIIPPLILLGGVSLLL